MRDKLSNLLDFNLQSRSCKNFEEVLITWKPLLSAVSAKKGVSESELLSTLLFKGFFAETDWVHADSGGGTEKQKNGVLDKLNDDVLSHCVSFLGHGDVLNSVERVCRRLFSVSRSIKKPFKCGAFHKLFRQKPFDAITLKSAAKRFEALELVAPLLRRDVDSVSLKAVASQFSGCLKHLAFDMHSIAVTQVHFDSLERIHTTAVDSSTVKQFVRRHPTVRHWLAVASVNNSVANAQFYADLRAMKSVDSVSLSLADNRRTDAFSLPMHQMLHSESLSQITSFHLANDSRFNCRLEFVRPFLHAKLRKLTICVAANAQFAMADAFPLNSLQQLDLRCGVLGHELLPFLSTEPLKLRQLTTSCTLLRGVLPYLRKCPFGELSLTIACLRDPVSHRRCVDECSQQLAATDWAGIRPKSLTLQLSHAIVPTQLRWAADYLGLFQQLAQCMAATKITLKWWKHPGFQWPEFERIESELKQMPNVTLSPHRIAALVQSRMG